MVCGHLHKIVSRECRICNTTTIDCSECNIIYLLGLPCIGCESNAQTMLEKSGHPTTSIVREYVGTPAIAVDMHDEVIVSIYLPILKQEYRTKLVNTANGDTSCRYDACLFRVKNDPNLRYGAWWEWSASHTIPSKVIPEWVNSPILCAVNEEALPKRSQIISLAKRLDNVYTSDGITLPSGMPASISIQSGDSLQNHYKEVVEVLRETPTRTLKLNR